MVTLIFSIISSVLTFFLTKNYLSFLLILLGVYFLIRKNERAESLAGLNMLLISAMALFGKFKFYDDTQIFLIIRGIFLMFIGTFLVILYDLMKKWYSLIPMLLLTGMGIGAIGYLRWGMKGYFLGLILIPVIIREYHLQKKATDELNNINNK
ncbi:hypothetical protein [Fervidobacterium gondwanense]|uniref:Uncharacterized protein n=1 Tax=Fervidobacterium gondwanense DSM 13020 TaxID=1121883 RepID=A0A1M7S7M9_FERGO|nr:hypothetical protein [Fervidobacterium gondwanense]SHN54481.1 hypothetical protein SAMN02745226_00614 [Fervidobacterium gondwanense DSM 13020]